MKYTRCSGHGHLPWVNYNIGGDETCIHADKFAHIISSNAIQNSRMKLYLSLKSIYVYNYEKL